MVSSQQRDPNRGLCDNSSKADSIETNGNHKMLMMAVRHRRSEESFELGTAFPLNHCFTACLDALKVT